MCIVKLCAQISYIYIYFNRRLSKKRKKSSGNRERNKNVHFSSRKGKNCILTSFSIASVHVIIETENESGTKSAVEVFHCRTLCASTHKWKKNETKYNDTFSESNYYLFYELIKTMTKKCESSKETANHVLFNNNNNN